MKAYDAGHRETETALPEPLTGTGFWSWTTFALPSAQLSYASAAIYVLVLLFLETGGVRRTLFVLPGRGAAILAAVAAALAWTIALRCRNRPGRLWPRIWALALASVNTAAIALGIAAPAESLPLVFAVAGLASAATLAPRLLRVRPDSPLIQRIAPISMIATAMVLLPVTCAARQSVMKRTETRITRKIAQLRLWTTEIQAITNYDWTRIEESPDAATRMIERLKGLQFADEVNDPGLWSAAEILGSSGELAAATESLSTAVVDGFAPQHTPKVSRLREPAMRWDDTVNRWQIYSQFTPLSEITGSYHQELGRLFAELGASATSSESDPAIAYRQHYVAQQKVLAQHLDSALQTWPDHWAVFRVPHQSDYTGRDHLALNELLRIPVLRGADRTYAPADLVRLATLPLDMAKAMTRGGPGCMAAEGRITPGAACRCINFDEKRREYYRLDCYAYSPASEGTGARLDVEMRLVYESPASKRLRSSSTPAEVYFHFLLPPKGDAERFRETVMTSLDTAVRQSAGIEESSIRTTDRGSSAANGFLIATRTAKIRVLRPAIVTLDGLPGEPTALLVRAVPSL